MKIALGSQIGRIACMANGIAIPSGGMNSPTMTNRGYVSCLRNPASGVVWTACLMMVLLCVPLAGLKAAEGSPAATTHRSWQVEGWTIRIEVRLLEEHPATARAALTELTNQLYRIKRVVPEAALAKLHEVPIWVGVEDEHGRHKCMCYHPDRDWLVENGYNPEKAGCVDLANAETFVKWTHIQPWMVLHELAHAYHHRVVTHEHEGVRHAYESAVKRGNYESVLYYNGEHRRAYALNNQQEYFAEASEAFFGTNDFYPFVRAELKEHDPEMFAVLQEVWGMP